MNPQTKGVLSPARKVKFRNRLTEQPADTLLRETQSHTHAACMSHSMACCSVWCQYDVVPWNVTTTTLTSPTSLSVDSDPLQHERRHTARNRCNFTSMYSPGFTSVLKYYNFPLDRDVAKIKRQKLELKFFEM